ncbi:MAG: CPBP family glutamic-type intramembrane protease [Terracidiphilus sp.]
MNGVPEQDANNLENFGAPEEQRAASADEQRAAEPDAGGFAPADVSAPEDGRGEIRASGIASAGSPPPHPWLEPSAPEPYGPHMLEGRPYDSSYPQFNFAPPPPQATIRRPPRIPNFGHLAMLIPFFVMGWIASMLLLYGAMHLHLLGVHTLDGVKSNAAYLLGMEAVIYAVAFGAAYVFMPLFWHRSFFAGVHWNGEAAMRRYRVLLSAAFFCFLLALLSEYLMPGPANAPIDKIFKAPGAAWMMFAFGVTIAPFFEELIFRGFLLPALSTAFDWIGEQMRQVAPPPLDENGHPQWSFGAMVFAAVCTSIPFALLHAAQTGYSLGPFILLVFVSLVLCWARLSTRSLAASVMIHASYNFMLFMLMMLGSGGFRHMQNM